MDKLVTVVIPCYNAEKCIGSCLKSVLSQTYSNLEIIVINDASKDRTLLKLQEYGKIDSRIRVLNNLQQGGEIFHGSVEYQRLMVIICALWMLMIGFQTTP